MHPSIQGHRGARGRRPENTLPAIEYALKCGVDGIEVDLCITKDNAIVLHHNLALNPMNTRDAHGQWIDQCISIHDLRLDELRQYDVGRIRSDSDYAKKFPEQQPMDRVSIPTLEEFIECIQTHIATGGDNIILNLELKSNPHTPDLTPPIDTYVAIVSDKIEQLESSKNIFVQSFDWRLAAAMKKRQPELKIGFIQEGRYQPADLCSIKQQGGDAWSCNYRWLTPSLLQAAHALGLDVWAWTVNDVIDMTTMAEMGVDVITTDYPERARNLFSG